MMKNTICLLAILSLLACSSNEEEKFDEYFARVKGSQVLKKYKGFTIGPRRSEYTDDVRHIYMPKTGDYTFEKNMFGKLDLKSRFPGSPEPNKDLIESVQDSLNELNLIGLYSNDTYATLFTTYSDSSYAQLKDANPKYFDNELPDSEAFLDTTYRYVLVRLYEKEGADSIFNMMWPKKTLSKLEDGWYYYRTHDFLNIKEF